MVPERPRRLQPDSALGKPHCPRCGRVISSQSAEQIAERLARYPEGTVLALLAPVVRGRKGAFKKELAELGKGQGGPERFAPVREALKRANQLWNQGKRHEAMACHASSTKSKIEPDHR